MLAHTHNGIECTTIKATVANNDSWTLAKRSSYTNVEQMKSLGNINRWIVFF